MTRFRTHWLALLGAALLLALSVSSAFGAHPQDAENRGSAVSSFVHDLVFGSDEDPDQEEGDEGEDEEGAEEGDDAEEADETDEEQSEDEQSEEDGDSNHGQCVREVAWALDEVGGLNENHGGAVSEAARVTCWGSDDEEEPTESEDEGDSEGEALTSDSGSHDRGNSAAAHERAPGWNKLDAFSTHPGHGRGGGHGR